LILLIFGRAMQYLLALVMMRVATTLLSPEQVGVVAIVSASGGFFAMFFVNPVGMFINRRLLVWHLSGVAQNYLIRFAGYLLLVAITAGMFLTLLSLSSIMDFRVSIAWLVILVCGSLFFNTISQTTLSSLNFLGYRGQFILLSVSTISASLVCAVLLVKTEHPSAEWWLFGLLLGQVLFAIIGIRVLFSHLQDPATISKSGQITKRHLQSLLSFAWPVAIAAGLAWVQGQGYRYIMESQLGLAQLGLFVAGYGISAGIISGFESVLTTYFQPRLYRDANSDHPVRQAQAWQRYAAAVIPSLLLTLALIVMLRPELTRIFLGERFQSASDYVIWGALAEAARVLMGVYSMIAHVHMRTRWLIIPNVIGATLAIALSALLIPHLGAAGAGVGLAISGFAVVATMHILLARWVGGGISMRPVAIAGGAAVALWWMTLGLRYLLGAVSPWGRIVGVLVLVGMAYMGLQFLFLRQHLTEKSDA
jgi:O-antigen/teichoic acid export membrane protein